MNFLKDTCIWDGLTPTNHPGSNPAEKDVGVLIDSRLNMSEQYKTNRGLTAPWAVSMEMKTEAHQIY